ncbi:MAG: ribonuclease H-like domain-containing protein [Vicinamibacterales bacterium]
MALKPSLADRLRAVVGGSAVPRVHPDAGGPPPLVPASARSEDGASDAAGGLEGRAARAARAAATLGGALDTRADGLCIVVDRRYEADARHGRQRVGDIVHGLRRTAGGLRALGAAWPGSGGAPGGQGLGAPDGLCVVDLETTGLAGGAGTQAFLVGCARLDGDGVSVRQFLAPGFEFERAQLAALAEWMADRTWLVTFNGRTFDVPLLEMRFAFNRLRWPWAELPHLDALHPARRFWRDRSVLTGPDPDEASCSLGVLERRLSGVHRVGDVPGAEIPARYFQFARDGRAEPLEAVLEHNRLDLLSTLLVCARASRLVAEGPAAAERGQECLGLGRVYERLSETAQAEGCYARAAAEGLGLGDPLLRAEALRRLAFLQRRAGRPDQAAASWSALLATRGAPGRLRREAREALAIHHEHRARDLEAARAVVLEGLREAPDDSRRTGSQHRLARIERKLARQAPGRLLPSFDDDVV